MSGKCVECGSDAAAGHLGTLCAECVESVAERERDRIVLDTHYQDGRGRRLIAERDGETWDVVEYRLTKGDEWRPVGTEGAEDVTLRAE